MSGKKFLPNKDNDLLVWGTSFLAILASILPRIEFPADEHAALTALLNTFRTKLGIADAPATRTKAAVQDKNDAREALEKRIRQAVNEYLAFNHRVTDGDRDNLGLPIRKKTRTDAPVADKAPYFAVSGDGPRRVRFDFGASKDSAAKPDGQHGAEFIMVIADTKPAEIEDLTRSAFDTHTPLILTFKESERGKTLWFAARWENTSGKKGPWSPIESAIIPLWQWAVSSGQFSVGSAGAPAIQNSKLKTVLRQQIRN